MSTISKFWPSRLLKYSSILPLMMPSGCASVLCLPGVRGAGGERSSKGGGKTDLAGVAYRSRPSRLAMYGVTLLPVSPVITFAASSGAAT